MNHIQIDNETLEKRCKCCWWCLIDKHEKALYPMLHFFAHVLTPKNCNVQLTGLYCGYSCCLAFLKAWRYPNDIIQLLNVAYRQSRPQMSLEDGEFLTPALPPFLLEHPFGGPMSYTEYHKYTSETSALPLANTTLSHKMMIDIQLEPYFEKKKKLQEIMQHAAMDNNEENSGTRDVVPWSQLSQMNLKET